MLEVVLGGREAATIDARDGRILPRLEPLVDAVRFDWVSELSPDPSDIEAIDGFWSVPITDAISLFEMTLRPRVDLSSLNVSFVSLA